MTRSGLSAYMKLCRSLRMEVLKRAIEEDKMMLVSMAYKQKQAILSIRVCPYAWFCFPRFQLPTVNHGVKNIKWKVLDRNNS